MLLFGMILLVKCGRLWNVVFFVVMMILVSSVYLVWMCVLFLMVVIMGMWMLAMFFRIWVFLLCIFD